MTTYPHRASTSNAEKRSKMHLARWVVITALCTMAAACTPQYPTGMPDPPQVRADQIMSTYMSNEVKANATYKGQWFTVTAGPITKVESGGQVKVQIRTLLSMTLDFADDSDVIELNPGDQITAVCLVKGFFLNMDLLFDGCKWPQGNAEYPVFLTEQGIFMDMEKFERGIDACAKIEPPFSEKDIAAAVRAHEQQDSNGEWSKSAEDMERENSLHQLTLPTENTYNYDDLSEDCMYLHKVCDVLATDPELMQGSPAILCQAAEEGELDQVIKSE